MKEIEISLAVFPLEGVTWVLNVKKHPVLKHHKEKKLEGAFAQMGY